jgi:hypothetical protein
MTKRAKIAVGYSGIILWMFLPMIPVMLASLIASHCGSKLDEGGPHPCIVFGRDIGGTLYSMFVMGWFGLITFPSGLLALIVFTVMIIKGRKFELGV